MKLGTKLVAAATAAITACTLTVVTAPADVFHGYWIGGRIEETYHRLGGWGRFGDATTPESVSA